MSDYLLVYEGGDHDWMNKWPAEKIERVMQEWGAWFKDLESKGVLRNPGSALAPGGAAVTRNGKSFVTDTAMAEVKELIGGFSVIRTDSLEKAVQLAQGSPFLENNPQGRIRVQPIFEPPA
jgi:hypothetical protein